MHPFALIGASLIALALFILPARANEPTPVQTIRVPDGGIQPQVQTDSRGRLHLIYFKGDPRHGDIFYVRSTDGGTTFSNPLKVNSQAQSVIAIGTIRGPRLSLGKNDRVHVAWMGSDLAEPKLNDKFPPMLYARLNDASDRFEPQRNIIQKHVGLDGGGAVASDAEGNVYVAWHAPDEGTGEANRRVWLARSTDDGKTFAPEMPILAEKTGVCGCCGMTIAAGPKGAVYVLFRSATEQVNRNMYLLASEDFGKTFKVVGNDPWNVGLCVMSTAHFAVEGDGVLAVWETKNQIRMARVRQDGSGSMSASSVPGQSGNRKHPAVAVNSRGEYLIAWTEGTGWNKGGAIAWQIFDKDGKPEAGKSGLAQGLPAWDVPAVFAAADGTFRLAF